LNLFGIGKKSKKDSDCNCSSCNGHCGERQEPTPEQIKDLAQRHILKGLGLRVLSDEALVGICSKADLPEGCMEKIMLSKQTAKEAAEILRQAIIERTKAAEPENALGESTEKAVGEQG
jgi:hypothetical protein